MKRPYRFTTAARYIAIIYGAAFTVVTIILSLSCDCSFKQMYQMYGLFWMVFSLAGLVLLWYILRTSDKVE